MMKKKLYATLLGTGVALATMSSVFAAEPSTEQQVNESATVQAHGWHKGGKMTESKLEELAKEKGITVNELKQQMKQKKEAKLEQMAKKKGITVEELKQQLQKKHEEKLEEIAKQKGISVDELKKQLPNGGQL
ncbi:hypothetical protein P9597_24195 [Aneurinibacillus migulanus]|uniref:hypothetical protein n=1 Tax=Aneurinibacillus migulanus TaxID=47500 RepID=UPI002E208500|nr:hypothetical protein [Aneurinibacillus migulanus]